MYRENMPEMPERVKKTKHPLYEMWRSMIRRCHEPKFPHYKNYGGRGITVCQRWRNSFSAFVQDVGKRPSKEHSLDRIDNNLNYKPGNVRWATRSEQNRNTRFNRLITANGKTKTLQEWSEETGMSKSTIFNRIKRGWNGEQVINTPVQEKSPDNTLLPVDSREMVTSLGLNVKTVTSRLTRGWSFEDAITKPIDESRRRK